MFLSGSVPVKLLISNSSVLGTKCFLNMFFVVDYYLTSRTCIIFTICLFGIAAHGFDILESETEKGTKYDSLKSK